MARWGRGLFLLMGLGVSAPSWAADQLSNVRTGEPAVQALLDWGMTHSPTLTSLVETLNRSDLIVYVQQGTLPAGVGGVLLHRIVSRGGRRYVRILVSLRGARERLTGVIAHELQHAVELAQPPTSGTTMTSPRSSGASDSPPTASVRAPRRRQPSPCRHA